MNMTGFQELSRRTLCAIRPIQRWPGSLSNERRTSQFRADWRNTCSLLGTELYHVAQEQGRVLQVAVRENMWRQDGMPRADVKGLEHPGVILAFTHDNGQAVSMPCDTYTNWQDNVRAIALALEALRSVDRYGVTKRGEQYAGWTAIESRKSNGFHSAEEAALFLEVHGGQPLESILTHKRSREAAYREAARRLHPDLGGSHEQFVMLQAAKELLEAK